MRSLRAELADVGVALTPDEELRDCDEALRYVAFCLVQDGLADPLPEQLLDSLETFADLAAFANIRRSQSGLAEAWVA